MTETIKHRVSLDAITRSVHRKFNCVNVFIWESGNIFYSLAIMQWCKDLKPYPNTGKSWITGLAYLHFTIYNEVRIFMFICNLLQKNYLFLLENSGSKVMWGGGW